MLEELDQQSLLLLYLADELEPAQHAALEQRLSADIGLAGEVGKLRRSMESFNAGMTALDTRQPLNGQAAAVRRIGLAMRSQLARQAVGQRPASNRPTVNSPYRMRLVYVGSAVAAALALGFVWWNHLAVRPTASPSVVVAPLGSETPVADADKPADDAARDLLPDSNPAQTPRSVASLELAERQLAELAQTSNSPLPSVFDQAGGNEQQ